MDEGTDELVCTGEHPFFASNRGSFVAAKELVEGDILAAANGDAHRVISIRAQEAEGNGRFETYNFEVAGTHTYFVGPSGIWVHNAGKAPCERVFSLYQQFRTRTGLDPWDAYLELRKKGKKISNSTFRKTFLEVADEYKLSLGADWNKVNLPDPWQPGSQLDKKFKHAELFGVTGTKNTANRTEFRDALLEFAARPELKTIEGTITGYDGKVVVLLDTDTGLFICRKKINNEFHTAFRFDPGQLDRFTRSLRVTKP